MAQRTPLVCRPLICMVLFPVALLLLTLLLALLVNGGPLRYAGVVALPFDFRVRWECENTLHGFSEIKLAMSGSARGMARISYLILSTLPPSLRVQILNISSPFRTLKTTPQTSSLASAN